MQIFDIMIQGEPEIKARAVLPNTEIKDRNIKQFRVKRGAVLWVKYENEEHIIIDKRISAKKGYKFDGATIPFNIGKGDMCLLIPALFHDIICEKKYLVDYNRKLSSLIFKELLIRCGVNKVKAQIMYLAVDTYQRFQKGWKKKEYE